MSKSIQNSSIAAHTNNSLSSLQKVGLAVGFVGLFILTLAFLMYHFLIKYFGYQSP